MLDTHTPSYQNLGSSQMLNYLGEVLHRDEPITGVTSKKVMHLSNQLPNRNYLIFNIFMDNFFSTIPLFKNQTNRGIGACGTVRINSPLFPSSLKGFKDGGLNWDEKDPEMINDVLAVLWMDNEPVT